MYKYTDRFTVNKLKYNLVVFFERCVFSSSSILVRYICFCLVGQTCMVKGNNQLNERTVNYHDRIFRRILTWKMVVRSAVDNHDRIFRCIYRLQRQEVCDLLYTCTYLLYTFMGDASFFFITRPWAMPYVFTRLNKWFLDPIILHTFNYCKLRQEDTQLVI